MRQVERYRIHESIASGGMASVHLGKLASEDGSPKVVAVKVMHAHLATDPDFRAMFLDEARTVACIRHPNVVATLDVLGDTPQGELMLVMEYIHGPALALVLRALRERDARMPLAIAIKLTCDLLEGLHAAHDAVSDRGTPLAIVHRDVSPHNLLVGLDGSARVMDFGIATAADRIYATRNAEVKGKAWYMPPEQGRGERVDRRADVYAAGAVLFEMLTNRTPFVGNHNEVLFKLFLEPAPPPSTLAPGIGGELEAIVLRSLSKTPDERFETARAMAEALQAAGPVATTEEVAAWIAAEARDFFAARDALLARITAEGAAVGRVRDREKTSPPGATEPRRGGRWLVVAAVATAVGTLLAVRLRSTPAAVGPAAALSAGGGPVHSDEVPPPSSVASVAASASPSVSPSSTPSASNALSSSRRAVRPAGRPTLDRSAVPALPAVPPSATSPPPAPQCCIQVAGAWQRYSFRADCIDNCPPGMR